MLSTATTTALIASSLAAPAALVAAAVLLAKRVVLPRAPKHVRVLARSDGSVTFEPRTDLVSPGVYGIWYDRSGHAVIGDTITADPDGVEREVLRVSGTPLRSSTLARWTTHLFRDAADVSSDAESVVVFLPGGPAPAWLIPAPGRRPSATWAIHIHGIRTTRVSALRSVPAFLALGVTSLVVSFRGDGEGPPTPNDASMLGTHEWRDVEAAIAYALARGAERIILVGWSLGGTVAMLAHERSLFRSFICGMVLIAPASNWRALIGERAARAGVTALAGRLACFALETQVLARHVGLPDPIDLAALDWTSTPRLCVPTLVVHSVADAEVPFSQSVRLAAANPSRCTLHPMFSPGHGAEYNVDPDAFDEAIAAWVERLGL